MFTGLIEELGVVKEMARGPSGRVPGVMRLGILSKNVLEDLQVGDSLAVNGVCLTVIRITDSEVGVDVSAETLEVTTLGSLRVGDGINLERAMRLSDRLGGHLVSGHVDGIGSIQERQSVDQCSVLRVSAPPRVLRYCVVKGSVAVDGISLTINDLAEKDFSVTIVPHTARMTTLGLKGIGALVNLEGDLIGKHVERLLSHDAAGTESPRIDIDFLKKNHLL